MQGYFCLTCLFFLLCTNTKAQNKPTAEQLNGPDSLCYKKIYSLSRQLKDEGARARYGIDSNFFFLFLGNEALSAQNQLRILNIGPDAKISLQIDSMIFAGTKQDGEVITLAVSQQPPVLNQRDFEHCRSTSLSLNNTITGDLAFQNPRLVYVGIRFWYSVDPGCTACNDRVVNLAFDFRENKEEKKE